eukprot:14131520-Ditylum_brightwellii.AAC.1
MKLLMITQQSNLNEAGIGMGQKVQAQHVLMTRSKLRQTQYVTTDQNSTINTERKDDSTISRDLSGVKGPRLTCMSDMELIMPRSMHTTRNSMHTNDHQSKLNNQL